MGLGKYPRLKPRNWKSRATAQFNAWFGIIPEMLPNPGAFAGSISSITA